MFIVVVVVNRNRIPYDIKYISIIFFIPFDSFTNQLNILIQVQMDHHLVSLISFISFLFILFHLIFYPLPIIITYRLTFEIWK